MAITIPMGAIIRKPRCRTLRVALTLPGSIAIGFGFIWRD